MIADDFVTDAEIARRWRVSDKTARVAIRALERNATFPKRDPLFASKRYWPAVRAFMARRYGAIVPDQDTPDGEENLNAKPSENRRRTRPAMAASR